MTAAEARMEEAAYMAWVQLEARSAALPHDDILKIRADSLRCALDTWRAEIRAAEQAEMRRKIAEDLRERYGVLANHERLRRMEVGNG